jgi:N-acetylmuramic acid 6-phosphate etherase
MRKYDLSDRAQSDIGVDEGAPTEAAEEGTAMLTEHINPRFVDLDSWSTSGMIEALYEGQLVACAAVRPALPAINAAVDDAVSALKRGGRLVYVGAGTSGRIAIQDGAELRPTYDWPNDRIVFVMAGGMQAVLQSVEGAEDDEAKGAEAIADAEVSEHDVVIAVAASGTTPFTIGALRCAGARAALCIAVANNQGAPLFELAQHRILIETGTEVLAGSTRMQAGTAQKIVLNLFSTAVMVKLGRVYRGLMVNMRASNAKLLRRAEIIVSQIVGCDENDAVKFVERAEGDVKIAILLGLGWEQTEAVEALLKHEGNLRSVIEGLTHDRT